MVKVILHVIKYLPSSKTICNTSLASINCLLSCWAMFSLSMLVFKELSKNRKHIAKDCGLFPLSHNAMPNCLADDYSNMEKLWLTLSLSSSTNTKNCSTVATTVSCMAVNCAEMSVYGSNNGSQAQKIELTRLLSYWSMIINSVCHSQCFTFGFYSLLYDAGNSHTAVGSGLTINVKTLT